MWTLESESEEGQGEGEGDRGHDIFPSALFNFHKSKMAIEAGNACAGISALFRQHFSFPVNPIWRLRWRMQNTFRREKGFKGAG